MTENDEKYFQQLNQEIENFRTSSPQKQLSSSIFKVSHHMTAPRKKSIAGMYLPEEIISPTVSSFQIMTKENSMLETWENQKKRKKLATLMQES